MSTVLIDYGSGNLRSAEKALQAAADDPADIVTTGDPDRVRTADRVVLPGVGAFRACMEALRAREGLVEALTEAVHARGAPFLGVCVGMQLLASRGLEFGAAPGLDWIPGEVRRLEDMERALIQFALDYYRGQMSEMARKLGIGRSTLYRKMKEYGLQGDGQDDVA
ncbi:MAG: hypothetical protein INR64_18190, partial [Caulobacteraceae bacterium]|nr:hypothetical protein [Caulobacter sp.]